MCPTLPAPRWVLDSRLRVGTPDSARFFLSPLRKQLDITWMGPPLPELHPSPTRCSPPLCSSHQVSNITILIGVTILA